MIPSPIGNRIQATANPNRKGLDYRTATCTEAWNSNPAAHREINRVSQSLNTYAHSVLAILAVMVAALLTPNSAAAYDFEADGFYYEADIENMTARLVAGENKQAGEISVPETVSYKGRDFSVTSIGDAFTGNADITTVALPQSIVTLLPNAFAGCRSIQTITGLDNITTMGEGCFNGCSSLTTVFP